jgi:NADH-quinone oxidoreductase subunit N
LVFGAAAGTNLDTVALAMYAHGFNTPLFLAGVGFIVVGFGFKMAAAPFHFWSPDVYQGAPTCVTGFMAVGVKAAAVAGLLRLISVLFQGITDELTPVVWGLAALTMVVGNLAALSQTNIKRLLAYSSIAHAGYLLVALSPFGQGMLAEDMFTSVLFYLVVYGLNSFGAWAVVIALEYAVDEWKEPKGLTLEEYAGLGRTHPWLAAAMLVFMLSFTGMPLTLGFWGKFYLFRTAVEGGFIWLALIGLLASLASAYYYLRVVIYMFMKPGEPVVTGEEPWAFVVAYAAAALVVVLSFVPGPLLALAAGALPGL